MADTKTNFEKGITYMDAINMFNDLNDSLGGDGFYRFQEKLTDMEGRTVPGFIYKGYMAGQGLRKVLNNLGIEYVTHMKSGTGVDEESEIIVSPESVGKMMDIYKKIGFMQSRQRITVNHKLEKPVYFDQVIKR